MSRKNEKKKMSQPVRLKEKIENFFYSDTSTATATKFLLMFLAVGVVGMGGAIIPGIVKAIGSFGMPEKNTKRYGKKQIGNAFANLKRQKLVEIVRRKDGTFQVRLTNKGKKRLLEFSIETLVIKKPSSWDKKWRIVIFDIPNNMNAAREALRRKVKELGLLQLQKSVWIFPYECEDEILFIAEIFEVQKHIEIIRADKLLHEDVLKRRFKLR